jgi:predicted enzyme related to lactoylglutathione lyase
VKQRFKAVCLSLLGALVAPLIISAPVAAQSPTVPPLNASASGVELPGKFIWFDLSTPAIDAQKAFYGYVFGWTFEAPSPTDDGYVLIMNSGQAVGGMFNFEPPGGAQDGAIWIALMATADIDGMARAVTANGGSIELAPANVPQRGRHALFKDPAGALFGGLKSGSGDPPDAEPGIGDIIWVDLFARNVEQMTQFYNRLAPYEEDRRTVAEEVERVVLSAHGTPRAGIVQVSEEANRSAWVPYVRVEDVDATLEKVLAGGGFAIVPSDERLLDGNLAIFVDPNGGVTGIVKWEYAEEASE